MKLTFTATNSVTGAERTTEEEYQTTGEEGPERTYYRVYGGVVGGMGYSGFANDEAFIQYWLEEKRKQHAAWEKSSQETKEAEERAAKYDQTLGPRVQALFPDDDYVRKIIKSAVVDYGLVYDERLSSMPDKQLKKEIREAMSEGKRDARENYPEDYRDADPKEDFYDDMEDDVAQVVAMNLR